MTVHNTRLGAVVVVGGGGFLGHHIVKQLLEDPTVTSIHVMSRNPKNRITDSRLSYVVGDITVRADVDRFIADAKPSVVINTASPVAYIDHVHAPDYERKPTSLPQSDKNSTDKTKGVNVNGNAHLLAGSRLASVKAYIYTSSGPIIAGSGGAYAQADESHPTLAQLSPGAQASGDPYHVAKARGDALVLGANDASPGGMRTATIRPTAMYGEGDQQMIANLLAVRRRRETTVWLGDNTALMDSVYVGSVARAHVLAAHALLAGFEYDSSYSSSSSSSSEKSTGGKNGNAPPPPPPPKVDGEAFNITDDAPLPPWTFFRLFWIEMGDTTPLSKVWMIPSWLTLMMAIWAEWWTWFFSMGKYRPELLIKERIEFLLYTRTYSIKKARERLGFEPMLPMSEAIRRAVAWAVEEWPEEGEGGKLVA